MRGAALAAGSVAISPRPVLVPPGLAALVAVAELAAGPFVAAPFAFETLARATAFLPARFTRGCAISGCRSGRLRGLIRFAKITMTVAAPMPMPLPLGTLPRLTCGGFAGGRRRSTLGRTLVAAMGFAVMPRPTLVGAAAGPPDLDQ